MSLFAKLGAALTALLIAWVLAPAAHAQDPITWHSLDGGGATVVSGGSYKMGGTIGQADAGELAGGAFTLRGGFWLGGHAGVTDVTQDQAPVLVFRFLRSPNPVRFQSRVAFELPSTESVRLSFFDIAGRVAKRLDFGLIPAGHHERGWRAEDDTGHPLASGVYYLRLEAGRQRATQKVLILR